MSHLNQVQQLRLPANPATRSIPAFLNKLYAMVSDPATDIYIHWALNSHAFIVMDQQTFSTIVLPMFFKHSNFTSFIRQLNMYGFHKIPHIHQGALAQSHDASLEFSHESFQRDRPDLLCFVHRRKNTAPELLNGTTGTVDFPSVLSEIAAIKMHQMQISSDFHTIQAESHEVWNEALKLKEKYEEQQTTIVKILGFLASVFSTKKNPEFPAEKKMRLRIEHSESGTPEINEIDDASMQQLAELISLPSNALFHKAAHADDTILPTSSLFHKASTVDSPVSNLTSPKSADLIGGLDGLLSCTRKASETTLTGVDSTTSLDKFFDFDNTESTKPHNEPNQSNLQQANQKSKELLNNDHIGYLESDLDILNHRLDGLSHVMQSHPHWDTQWEFDDSNFHGATDEQNKELQTVIGQKDLDEFFK